MVNIGLARRVVTYRRGNDQFALTLDVGFRHAIELVTLLLAEGSEDRITDYWSADSSRPLGRQVGRRTVVSLINAV
jgi:hypothetical protein